MTEEEEINERIFELRYWQQISDDLGKIGEHIREIGKESAGQVALRPLDFLHAGDMILGLLERTEKIGAIVLGLQDLVNGRLTYIEKKTDADG